MRFLNKKHKKSILVKRLLAFYDSATNEERNSNWYIEANQFAIELAERFNKPLIQVCGVIAALSPQKNWQENKRLAVLFLQGKNHGQTKMQLKKADSCLLTECETEIFNLLTKNGLKTSQFFLNLLHPNKSIGITIDRHAVGACLFTPNNIEALPEIRMTKTQYDVFQDVYISTANKLAIKPHELQAIVWKAYRRLKGLPLAYNTIPF